MQEEMVFDRLETITVPITIGKRKFRIQEADADTGIEYDHELDKCRVYDEKTGEQTGWNKAGRVETFLVSKCLVEIVPGEEGAVEGYQSIPLDEISRWRHQVVKKIYNKIREISGMIRGETREDLLKRKAEIEERLKELETREPLKNGQSGSETSSS